MGENPVSYFEAPLTRDLELPSLVIDGTWLKCLKKSFEILPKFLLFNVRLLQTQA